MAANLDNGVILGALGSSFSNSADVIYPPTNMVIVSIQFLGVNGVTTLVAENADKFFNTAEAANSLNDPGAVGGVTVDEGGGGDTLATAAIFQPGTVIYGRWTSAQFNNHTDGSSGVICYFGY